MCLAVAAKGEDNTVEINKSRVTKSSLPILTFKVTRFAYDYVITHRDAIPRDITLEISRKNALIVVAIATRNASSSLICRNIFFPPFISR